MITRRAMWLSCVFAMGLGLIGIGGAEAVPTLDFVMNAPTGGTISYAGGTAPLVGSGIQVDSVVGGLGTAGTATPSNNGTVATCVGCTLSFTTGNLVGTSSNQWTFAGGGSITLVGGIDFADGTPDVAAGTTLFSGSWGPDVIVTDLGVINAKLQGGVFSDITNPQLAAFYGLLGGPDHQWNGSLSLNFFALGLPPYRFTSFATGSGDLTNAPVPNPEPGTLILLGTALVGVGAWTRRRRAQR